VDENLYRNDEDDHHGRQTACDHRDRAVDDHHRGVDLVMGGRHLGEDLARSFQDVNRRSDVGQIPYRDGQNCSDGVQT
jgi:hypothetical protein